MGQKLSVQFAFGDRKTPGQMKGQKEAVVILQEIRKIQMQYRRQQKEKRRRSRERRAAAGLPPTTSDEDTSDEEIPPPVSYTTYSPVQLSWHQHSWQV